MISRPQGTLMKGGKKSDRDPPQKAIQCGGFFSLDGSFFSPHWWLSPGQALLRSIPMLYSVSQRQRHSKIFDNNTAIYA
jgi:hypothetical protein